MFTKPLFVVSLVALASSSCTHSASKPEDSNSIAAVAPSPAYQYALNHAFADLAEKQAKERTPASARRHLEAKTQNFTVFVYPKTRALNDQRQGGERPIHLSEESEFLVSITPTGNCATAGELVPASQRNGCITVEMRPKPHKPVQKHPRDVVRVYMDADYHAFGMTYHEVDAKNGGLSAARKKVRLNPREPLSSELLSLSRDIAPLDLPVHASNAFNETQGPLDLAQELGSLETPLKDRKSFLQSQVMRDRQACQGSVISYKNTYGSPIHVAWCAGDPWPTSVETDRYLALLAP